MTTDSMITLIGTVVTLGGAGITIWQSKEARNYKNQLKFDVRKINLTNVSERLKRAQDEIRRLPTSLQGIQRGTKPSDLIHKTKEYFDIALGTLDAKGPDADIRQLLVEAQKKLNSYETGWHSGTPNPQDVHDLQAKIQDAISAMNSTIYKMEGKA
ncbi:MULTISPECIES: hypothetical protein [Citrobacter]|uniref:Uncharacterized protein n=2 Tax=Gammaproteobacteria TaxID=1236 RepID=A0ABR6TRT9_CITBR|nr:MULTISPECIES: hypothetical protein [Citrobacter]MCN3044531.1 hypothetical protein [Escherichia coli]HDT1120806.1 hypothetical protein [Klebsiella aerogenes]MBC2609020.1 hypothetical protein [Citrobacter braakii]MBC2633061.1 hypothetical protein [Citrobacter braakii]MBC2645778.1 hypothetical protein [Citrobacter braakii]